jgi:hypothetical protein
MRVQYNIVDFNISFVWFAVKKLRKEHAKCDGEYTREQRRERDSVLSFVALKSA